MEILNASHRVENLLGVKYVVISETVLAVGGKNSSINRNTP